MRILLMWSIHILRNASCPALAWLEILASRTAFLASSCRVASVLSLNSLAISYLPAPRIFSTVLGSLPSTNFTNASLLERHISKALPDSFCSEILAMPEA